MWNILHVGAAAALVALAPASGAPQMQHAIGSFEVRIAPLSDDAADGVRLGRLAVDKTYAGALGATSHGEMATAMGSVPGSAAYVLIERVTGSLDGKPGSFALAHLGVMDRGTPEQRIVIVPDSGTGALAGLSGSMTIRIEGKAHFYDLAWTLAPR